LIEKGDAIKAVVKDVYEIAEQILNDTRKFIKTQPFNHYIRPGSVQGCFKIAKVLSFSSLSRSKCSLTTDSTYLYVLNLS